ncbi:MAG: sensor histidine kinase, partial [Myxococcota bacterium]
DRRGLLAYFAAQTALLGVALGCSHGRAAMAVMPLISQACLVVPAAGVALVMTLWGGLLLAALEQPSGAALIQNGVSYLVAGSFTWLFTGVAIRERQARTEVERLAASLAEANARLETLTLERERVRLAHEIHDGVGHALTAARVQLEAARVMFERDPPRARGNLETAARLIQEGLDDVRQSVRALAEQAGAQLPLAARLARLCEDGAPPTTLELEGTARRLAPAEEHALFRSAQEALTNVRRHAGATRATVRLSFTADEVRLVVEDDGRGAEGAVPGVGLSGIAERARRHGGSSELSARPGGGTRLEVRLRVPSR